MAENFNAEPGMNSQSLFEELQDSIPPNLMPFLMSLNESQAKNQELLQQCKILLNNRQAVSATGVNSDLHPPGPNGRSTGSAPITPAMGQNGQNTASLPNGQAQATTPNNRLNGSGESNETNLLNLMTVDNAPNPFSDSSQRISNNPSRYARTSNDGQLQCKPSIYKLERLLRAFKSITYDNLYLEACISRNIVPQGLRMSKYPNRTVKDSLLYSELTDHFNDSGIHTLRILIKHNIKKLEDLKMEITALHEFVLKHEEFLVYKPLYDSIAPRIQRHVAFIIGIKQKKLNRDLWQYKEKRAYPIINDPPVQRSFQPFQQQQQFHQRRNFQHERGFYGQPQRQFQHYRQPPCFYSTDEQHNYRAQAIPSPPLHNTYSNISSPDSSDFSHDTAEVINNLHDSPQAFLAEGNVNMNQLPQTPPERGWRGRGAQRGTFRGRGRGFHRFQDLGRPMTTRSSLRN